jgi:hypothetical protein
MVNNPAAKGRISLSRITNTYETGKAVAEMELTLEAVQASAQRRADATGSSVLVYRSLVADSTRPVYGIAYTLPLWGERIGDRIYPQGAAV